MLAFPGPGSATLEMTTCLAGGECSLCGLLQTSRLCGSDDCTPSMAGSVSGPVFASGIPHCMPVCQIASTAVLRAVPECEVASLEPWLHDADAVVDALLRSRPAKPCLSTPKKVLFGALCSRAEMDRMFGHGQWRPPERFQIVQADNKKRMIDNARRTEHNQHTAICLKRSSPSASTSWLRWRHPLYADYKALTMPNFLQASNWLRIRFGT